MLTQYSSFLMHIGLVGFAIGAFYPGKLFAEFITTKNGEIFTGKILASTGKKVSIEAFGTNHEIAKSDIEKTSSTPGALTTTKVVISLKDKSTIHGKIRDFSEDVGLYIDSEIGSITVPSDKISGIQVLKPESADGMAKANTPGNLKSPSVLLGISGVTTYPPFSDTLKMGFGAVIFAEQYVDLPYISHLGIAGGIESISGAQTNLSVTEITAMIYARRNFAPFHGGLRLLSLTLAAGGGGIFATLQSKNSESASLKGEAIGMLMLKGGASFAVMRALHVRLELLNGFRLITGNNFWKPGIELGVVYAF